MYNNDLHEQYNLKQKIEYNKRTCKAKKRQSSQNMEMV